MKSLEEHLQYYEDENHRYISELEKKNAQLQEAEEKTEDLLKQVEQLRIELNSEEQNNKRLQKSDAQLKDELSEKTSQINHLSNIMQEYKNDRFELERALKDLLENFQLSKQSDENEITVLRQDNDNLKRKLDDVLAQNRNLTETIANLKESSRVETDTISELKEELGKIRKALDERSDINNKLFEENKVLNGDLESVKADDSEIQKKYDVSKIELEKAHKLADELNKIKLQLTDELNSLKVSYSSQRLENQKLRDEISSLKKEKIHDKDILVKNKELSFNLTKLEKEILDLKLNNEKQLLGKQQENKSLREQLQKENDQKDACFKQVTDLSRKLNLLIGREESLRKKNERTIMQISKMVPWCDKFKKQFNDIVKENTKSSSN